MAIPAENDNLPNVAVAIDAPITPSVHRRPGSTCCAISMSTNVMTAKGTHLRNARNAAFLT
jgi:hypothetical protein